MALLLATLAREDAEWGMHRRALMEGEHARGRHPQVGSEPGRPPGQKCCRRNLLPCVCGITDYLKEMRLSLEHLTFLPPSAALALLLAVWPMCRCAVRCRPGSGPEHPFPGAGVPALPVLACAVCFSVGMPVTACPPTCNSSMSGAPLFSVCRSRRDAQDYVVMLLRKAMFRWG